MKKSIYFNAIALLLISASFYTCTKEKDPGNQEQEVSFSIGNPTKNGSALKNALTNYLSDARKIVLTIQHADGSPTTYLSTEVNIFQMNTSFFSEKLMLKTGAYRLTEFLILDSLNNTIFAAPLKGSPLANEVAQPLPISFNVIKNINSVIDVEVLSTENKLPENFGLVNFPISEVKVLNFMIGVADLSGSKLLSAKLTVSNGSYLYIQILDSIPNNPVTIKDSSGLRTYTLTLEKAGYIKKSIKLTNDSLRLFNSAENHLPLLITLEKNKNLSTVTDVDGNVYHTIAIGTQIWMVENLKTSRYRNGDLIGTTNPVTLDIQLESIPKYQWSYDGNENNAATYGKLYTWNAINDTRKLTPAGWHIPNNEEWTILMHFLGENVGGGKLKETGSVHWLSPNTGATNETGFMALPCGYRSVSGNFGNLGNFGYWWSTDEYYPNPNFAWIWYLNNENSSLNNSPSNKGTGFSVRCIQDSF